MKNMIKVLLLLSLIIFFLVFGETLIQTYLPEYTMIDSTSQLLLYGGMAGYILFIVFVVLLQEEGYYRLKQIKPKISKTIHQIYIFVSVIFIALVFIGFTMYMAIILALMFMMVTALLDSLRDKIINQDSKLIYPKKTI